MMNNPLNWTQEEWSEAFEAYCRIRKRVLADTSEDDLNIKEVRALAAEFPHLVQYCCEDRIAYNNK